MMRVNDKKYPPSFDYEFYRKDKPFLESEENAFDHFQAVGKREGLKGSPACDQGYLIRYLQNLHPDKILEIGPGCAPKFNGSNVFYFDVKSRDELQKRYENHPGQEKIPEKIHYVDVTGNLRCIPEKFDIVFSSHAIEHSLDLIEHLNSVESLLNEEGIYVVVAPYKNYTFDYFKPVTIIEDVLSHHFQKPHETSFSLRTVLLEKNRRTHNLPERHWANDHGDISLNKKAIYEGIEHFEEIANHPVARSGYHNWIFTEESFRETINALHALELTTLKVQESYNTLFGNSSFSAILARCN